MEFSCRCYSTTGGITSLTLLPFGLWTPDNRQEHFLKPNCGTDKYTATVSMTTNSCDSVFRYRCYSAEVGYFR